MRHVDSVRATELLGFEGSFATRHVFKTQPYLHDHPSCLRCPDALSMVGASLSGNGCGSPNHIYRVSQEEWIKLRESVPYVKL